MTPAGIEPATFRFVGPHLNRCATAVPSDCNGIWIILTGFREILEYQMSQKFVQWEPGCFMRTDRQTDMPKLKVALLNFRNARAYKIHVHTSWILMVFVASKVLGNEPRIILEDLTCPRNVSLYTRCLHSLHLGDIQPLCHDYLRTSLLIWPV